MKNFLWGSCFGFTLSLVFIVVIKVFKRSYKPGKGKEALQEPEKNLSTNLEKNCMPIEHLKRKSSL